MFSNIMSFGLCGVEAFPVSVEADISDGLPGFIMVGYLAQEVREAQERVRASFKNSGFRLPPRKITVNLSPAGVRKEGTAYDLAIAVSMLCCLGQIAPESVNGSAFIGELGLDGSIKPVRGVLPRAYAASKLGINRVFLPAENVREGMAARGLEAVGAGSLKELAQLLADPASIKGSWFDDSLFPGEEDPEFDMDFDEIRGLATVRRASEAAVAGKHNILYIGPAGTGKTMAARRLATILPPLSLEESMELSKLYSICGLLTADRPLVRMRPFRSPHHSATAAALTGGGRNPRPGEISLATHGILFLDELAEFPPPLVDLLRQPMEEGRIVVSRSSRAVEFPADPLVAAAMNPCKCGFYPDLGRCRCSEAQIRRYLGRISGPFLDRIDIGVEVPLPPKFVGAGGREKGESSAVMRQRVMEARKRQEGRFAGERIRFNGQMKARQIERFCPLSKADQAFLEDVYRRLPFSIRGQEKILKTARTFADLDGKEEIGREQLMEAVAFRSFERSYWGFRFGE